MSKPAPIFTPETFRFFRELGRHNRKEWMDANRERYRQHVVEPFRVLLTAVAPSVLKLHPDFEIGGRTGSNFSRINRDIRFAADKSPYRTQMYLMFSDRNAPDGDDGQLYAGLSAEVVTAGFRIYGMGRASRLARISIPRALANLQWLARQRQRLGRKYESYWYSSERGDWHKHDGWPLQPEEWKRLKGWIVRRRMKPAAATRGTFVRDVQAIFRDLFPLYEFTSRPFWKP